jgi:hypothetical protein
MAEVPACPGRYMLQTHGAHGVTEVETNPNTELKWQMALSSLRALFQTMPCYFLVGFLVMVSRLLLGSRALGRAMRFGTHASAGSTVLYTNLVLNNL